MTSYWSERSAFYQRSKFRKVTILGIFGPSVLRAPAEQTKVATVLGIFGPSVLRVPAEQTKEATVLGN